MLQHHVIIEKLRDSFAALSWPAAFCRSPKETASTRALPFGIAIPEHRSAKPIKLNLEGDVGLPGAGGSGSRGSDSVGPGPGFSSGQPPRQQQRNRDSDQVQVVLDDQDDNSPEEDRDPSEWERKLDDDTEHLAASDRVGIVGYEFTTNDRSRCFVCAAKNRPKEIYAIKSGSLKFYWRAKVKQTEKSVHSQCVIDKSILEYAPERARKLSQRFLMDLVTLSGGELEPRLRSLLMDACDAFVGSASSSAGPYSSNRKFV